MALLALESWPRTLGLDTVRDGLSEVDLPGRFQIVQREDGYWLLDIAHNPDAVRQLVRTLAEVSLPEPRVALLAVLRDKPWPEMASLLRDVCDAAVLTIAPSAPPERRWELDAAGRSGRWRRVETCPDFDDALRRARELAGAGTVVVTGSAYTVGDVLVRLAV